MEGDGTSEKNDQSLGSKTLITLDGVIPHSPTSTVGSLTYYL